MDPVPQPFAMILILKAKGLKKPHRRVKIEDLSTGVLSIDIAGPYQVASSTEP